jgi:hypothetical protein
MPVSSGRKLPKRKKAKPKPSHRAASSRSQGPATPRPWLTRAKAVWGAVVFLIGSTGLFALVPRLSVSPGQPSSDTVPFSVPFEFENQGYIGLSNVRPSCITAVRWRTVEQQPVAIHDVAFLLRPIVPFLGPTDALTRECRVDRTIAIAGPTSDTPAQVVEADITFSLAFQFWKIPCDMHRYFRFVGNRSADGHWAWERQPVTQVTPFCSSDPWPEPRS